MSFQDETNSLVFWTSGVVARSLQIAADMRLARASPEVQNPARLSLILKAHWNNATMPRKLRIQYPGAMYHVASRGDRREDT